MAVSIAPRTKADARMANVARAAAKLFSRNTYLDTTMDEIAEAAKVSKGGLYYYFEKKSDVLFFILDRTIEDLLAGLEEDLAALPDPEARLKHIMRRQLSYYSDHLPEVQTLLNDRRCLDRPQLKAIDAKQERYFQIVRAVVADLIGRPDAREINPLAFAFFGLCNWIPGWYRPGGGIGIEELIETTYRLYTNGLASFSEGGK